MRIGKGKARQKSAFRLWKTIENGGIKKFQGYGDSNFIIDGLIICPASRIWASMNQVQEVKNYFETIIIILFRHIYQDFNSMSNKISKYTLLLQKGT